MICLTSQVWAFDSELWFAFDSVLWVGDVVGWRLRTVSEFVGTGRGYLAGCGDGVLERARLSDGRYVQLVRSSKQGGDTQQVVVVVVEFLRGRG
jgi:hypothetical protein